jgi:membrane-bound lytic murein transglycosylase A
MGATNRLGARNRPSRQGAPKTLLLAFLAAALAPACSLVPTAPAPKPEPVPVTGALPRLVLEEVTYAALPGWQDDETSAALPALLKSCNRLRLQPPERPVGPDGLAGEVRDWIAPCEALAAAEGSADDAVRASIEALFQPYRAYAGSERQGLLTGYYESELDGAATARDGFSTPVYGLPEDLVVADLGAFRADLAGTRLVGKVREGRFEPYYTRSEIDTGVLDDKAQPLFWGDSVDVFFLHIQGSGRVRMDDGRWIRVGFAGSNGHDFTAIGRRLLEDEKIGRGQASMQGIRDWLRANPEEARRYMQENARFIFFRTLEGEGPIGAQGVALTPGRSLAVDPDHLALGLPIYLETTWPGSDRPLRRLMVAQDRGSAIKGPLRGDFYWGSGDAALEYAGRMKEKARFFVLLPRKLAERRRLTS